MAVGFICYVFDLLRCIVLVLRLVGLVLRLVGLALRLVGLLLELRCPVLYCTVLYRIALISTVLHYRFCTALNRTALNFAELLCTVLYTAGRSTNF